MLRMLVIFTGKVSAPLAYTSYNRKPLEVRYEDLVSSPNTILKDLERQLGLKSRSSPVIDNVLKGPYNKRQHEKLSHDVDITRISSWRANLSPEQIAYINFKLFDIISVLGYEIEDISNFNPDSRLREFLYNARKKISNKLRRYYSVKKS